jgi:hypothetical protein
MRLLGASDKSKRVASNPLRFRNPFVILRGIARALPNQAISMLLKQQAQSYTSTTDYSIFCTNPIADPFHRKTAYGIWKNHFHSIPIGAMIN